MANPDQVTRGDWVYYHGSLSEYHGYMRVIASHFPFQSIDVEDTVRYHLRYKPGAGNYISNVRPQSFTIVGDDDV